MKKLLIFITIFVSGCIYVDDTASGINKYRLAKSRYSEYKLKNLKEQDIIYYELYKGELKDAVIIKNDTLLRIITCKTRSFLSDEYKYIEIKSYDELK